MSEQRIFAAHTGRVNRGGCRVCGRLENYLTFTVGHPMAVDAVMLLTICDDCFSELVCRGVGTLASVIDGDEADEEAR